MGIEGRMDEKSMPLLILETLLLNDKWLILMIGGQDLALSLRSRHRIAGSFVGRRRHGSTESAESVMPVVLMPEVCCCCQSLTLVDVVHQELCLSLENGWIDRTNVGKSILELAMTAMQVRTELKSSHILSGPCDQTGEDAVSAESRMISIPFVPHECSLGQDMAIGSVLGLHQCCEPLVARLPRAVLERCNQLQKVTRSTLSARPQSSGSKFGADFLIYPVWVDIMRLRCNSWQGDLRDCHASHLVFVVESRDFELKVVDANSRGRGISQQEVTEIPCVNFGLIVSLQQSCYCVHRLG
eukprot:751572-Hanusia_phi.AAC.7